MLLKLDNIMRRNERLTKGDIFIIFNIFYLLFCLLIKPFTWVYLALFVYLLPIIYGYLNEIMIDEEQVFITSFVIMNVIFFVIYFIYLSIKRNMENVKEKRIQEDIKSFFIFNNNVILSIIYDHINVLAKKYNLCKKVDEYGCENFDDFFKEKKYFFENILIKQIYNLEFISCYSNNRDIINSIALVKNKDGILETIIDSNYKFNSHFSFNFYNYSQLTVRQKKKYQYIIFELFEKDLELVFNLSPNLFNKDITMNDIKTGFEFENEVAKRLNNIGFKCYITRKSGDQGVDIIAEKNDISIAVQCKLYSKDVGNKAVQEVIAGQQFYKTNYACVVSNANYTKSAKELAEKSNVKLINIGYLEEDMEQYNKI